MNAPATYLRTSTQADMDFALQSAGLIDGDGQPQQGIDIITVGTIHIATGTEAVQTDDGTVEQTVFEQLPGWHVNVYGDLTAVQLALLPVVDPPPATPHVKLWT